MSYFPLFINLKDKKVLIVGGGKIAYRKLEKLINFEAKITIVAPDICKEIKELEQKNNNINLLEKSFEKEDIINSYLVIAATNDKAMNTKISNYCKEENIQINAVDDLENCTFIFPALIKKDNLTIGITTNGKTPEVSAMLRRKIQNSLPINTEKLIDDICTLRNKLKEIVTDQRTRAKIIKEIIVFLEEKETEIDYFELEEKMYNLIKNN